MRFYCCTMIILQDPADLYCFLDFSENCVKIVAVVVCADAMPLISYYDHCLLMRGGTPASTGISFRRKEYE